MAVRGRLRQTGAIAAVAQSASALITLACIAMVVISGLAIAWDAPG
jgi:hypothetical protein